MNGMKRLGYCLIMALAAVLALTSTSIAGANISGHGTLDAIEDNGRAVIITTKVDGGDPAARGVSGGYLVSDVAIVLNGKGRKTTLDKFRIPAKVDFTVEYTPAGAVLKKIREIPQ